MDSNWLGITEEELIHQLHMRFHLQPNVLKSAAADIITLHPDLRDDFKKFWTGDDENPDISILNWSYNDLLVKKHQTPISAWICLSWLKNDPKEANAALSRWTEHVNFSNRLLH